MREYAVISLATGTRYVQYWKDLINSFRSCNVDFSNITFYLLTDNLSLCETFAKEMGINLKGFQIPSYAWPEATLLRYREILKIRQDVTENIIIYLDADMLVKADFLRTLSPNSWDTGIALVSHPGYWRPKRLRAFLFYLKSPIQAFKDLSLKLRIGGLGSWETKSTSTAFVPRKLRRNYVCGGTWMGVRTSFFAMVDECALAVDLDLERGFIAKWHDESHLNKWKSEHVVEVLSPGYCFDPTYKNLFGERELIRAVRK
jgi:hypothetical protein